MKKSYRKRFFAACLTLILCLSTVTTAHAEIATGTKKTTNLNMYDQTIAQLNLYSVYLNTCGYDTVIYDDSTFVKNASKYNSYREIADSIVGSETDTYEIAKIFAYWTSKNVAYNTCTSYTILFQKLCSSYNIPCVYIDGNAYETTVNGGHHAWNAFYANGSWHMVDCTWLSQGSQYFDMSRDFIGSHRMCGEIKMSEVTIAKCSSWASETVQKAASNNLLNYAFYNSNSHAKTTGTSTPNFSYLTSNCTRETFAILAINLLEEYYGIEHYDGVSEFGTKWEKNEDYNDGIDALLKLKGVSLPSADTFTDTESRYVRAAYALGIISGYGNGSFGPANDLTREQAAKILANTASVMGITVADEDASAAFAAFSDGAKAASWARSCIGAVKALGIMNGTTATAFSPKGHYTTEQCIVTIERLYEYAAAN